MKTKKIILAIFSFLAALILVSCAPTTLEQQFKGMSSEKIFQDGEKAMAKHQYSKAVKYFEALEAIYPFGPYAQQGQMDIIFAYYKNSDAPSALAAADRYIHLYPQSKDVDYAYYMKGLINFQRGRNWMQNAFKVDPAENDLNYMRQSFADFNELVGTFPNSQYVPDARKRMVFIRNLLAQNELEAAQFYFRQKAYVAAINRANFIVQHYQGAPQVKAALVIIVKSNRAIGLDKPASDAAEVLRANYPNS